jgi:ABC-type multidrug transport system ATPase subunit
VIFSTHIVDDVKELCNDMAILNGGRILRHVKPVDSTNELKNKIWTKSVQRDDLESAENEFNILSSNYNVDNSLTIRVFSEKKPGTDFKKAEPQLDDVYFIALKEDQNNNS